MPRSSSKTANPKPNDNGDKSKQEKMRAEWATLGKEYDVVAPARSVAGHLTRKVPKAQWKARTRKRKLLEQADEEAAAIDFEEQPRQRLRGSRFAIEDQLIQESLVFPSSRRQALTPSDDDEEEEEQQQQQPITQQEDEVEEDDGEEDQSNEDAVDDIEGEEDEQDDVEGENEDLDGGDDEGDLHEEHVSEVTASGRKKVSDRTPKLKKRKMAPKSSARRRMYRLRNFQSQRLAQRHGDALAAHARGQPREAIQLLKEVAKDAPSAPQIYSSLGMVYEDMLKESRKRSIEENDKVLGEQSQAATVTIPIFDQPSDVIANADESIPDPSLAEQLDLAKKAYGSYHIAAILCKKDFMLWLRAADAGSEVVHILGQAMLLPTLDLTVVAYHRSEKRRWQSEVLRDLQAADSLKPPGIDVPCKLAAMHIELGNLSEALTILTDLKNHQIPASQGRSEFQSSYKAWLLYADLMLRVGHECIQWNRGNRFNDNYMFRRWLRKYSQVFDWQERRLQALCLALEAAAGTKSTGRFIQWMRNRAYDNCVQNIDGEKGAAAAAEEEETDKDDDNANEQLESERQMLLAKHRSEMEAFDKSTNDLELALNSAAAKDRKSNRDDLLKSQEDAVATLDKEYGGDEKQAIVEKKHDEMMADFHDSVPIAASCRQVCKIASELMKHLHGLEMYPGARLVGETVSNYLKERAAKNDRRRMASKRVEQWQQKMSQASFLFASYEEKSEDDDSDDGMSSGFLSDDEDLDREECNELVISLRKGILPPELRVLYGLALIGEGGRNFLAGKCLEAISDLEQETSSWLSAGEREMIASGEPLWYLFHRAMTEPLGRTAAYAFLADVLRKTRKEQEWSVHFSSWFRGHFKTLSEVGLKEELMGLRGDISPYVNFRKNQLLKILIAACTFDVLAAESPAQRSPITREIIATDNAQRVNMAIATMESLSEVLYLMWKVDADGSLPSICAEAVAVSSKCLQWLAKQSRANKLSYNQLHTLLRYATMFLSFLSGESLPDFKSSEGVKVLTDWDWGVIPIKSTWQAPEYRPISLRTYNLTVGCNVSLFSGWEPNEFTLQLLRRRHGHKHFGVHLRENRVTGYLSPSLEEEIARQWDQVRKILPSFPDIKFRDRINEVKELDWYKGEVTERERTLEGCAIARYGEEDAEGFFLAFSALCLHLATSEESSHVTNRLLHASLSILLPVSQFCVDDRLWDSDIGEAATSLSSFDEWKLLNRMGVDAVMDSLDKDKPKRRRKSDKVIERKVQEWIKGTDKRTLKSFVSLPVKELRRLWFQGAEELTTDAKDASRQCMEKVHMATKKLRGCYTEMATERASLNVSVALLELASSPGCFDPFLCLQQAAMFASQACKAGNSDTSYRAGLPEKTECTPLQALVILGRADCLHSVRFPNEAAFLCSYVAKVCRLHRDNEGTEDAELEWNARWKIVAISAYNTSVMIRTTVSSVLEKQQQNSFLSMWERDVVEELERGRTDGWVWKRSLYNGGDGVILPPDLNDLDDFEADEEDYNSIDDDDDDDESENGDHDDDDVPDSDYQKLEAVPRSMDEHLAMLTLPYDASLIPMNVHEFAEVAVVQKGEDEEDNDNDNGFEGITMVSV